MGRKPERALIKRILGSLADSPCTIQEIAKATESNWKSVKEHLESLKGAGVVMEGSVGGKRVFSLSQVFAKKKSENYFGLPICEKDDALIPSLFSKIKVEWRRQYNAENNVLYQKKELILALLASSDFSRKKIREVNDLFYDFLVSLPEIPDKDSKSLVNDFVGVVFQLVNGLPEEELGRVKPYALQAFGEVWKLVALYGYLGDLKRHYEKNYGKGVLRKHFSVEISLQKAEVGEQLSHLESLLPIAEEPSDPAYQSLKKILGSGRLLSEEERKQKDEELKKMGSSDLFRKFGLD